MNERLTEIEARMNAIADEIDNATGEALTALETEVEQLTQERQAIMDDIQRRQQLRQNVAAGVIPATIVNENQEERDMPNTAETRAAEFAASNRMTIETTQARATLISGGTIATPTQVSGINPLGTQVSSIVDLVKVVDCEGMGSNIVAYEAAGSSAAAQTEGQSANGSDPTFGKVTIQPSSYAVLSYISKQVRKQSPLLYEAKVRESALKALRKKASAAIVDAVNASALTQTVNATLASGKGKINENTLRKLVLSYGTDEEVAGQAVLVLNKADLIAFGEVRGTNDKKAIYEITPDTANPNMGIIKEGGLAVRYIINSNVAACAGTAQDSTAKKTMFYGNPLNCELDLFSKYEINVSEDFAIDKLLLTIVGDVEFGTSVVAANGFAILTIPANA